MRIFFEREGAGVIALSLQSLLSSIPLRAQAAAPADHGAFEITSGLVRSLYALPDDAAARQALASDAQNADLALKLSKAKAARRQYKGLCCKVSVSA